LKNDKELIVVHEDSFVFRGMKINYAVLESNRVIIAYSSIIKLLNISASEIAHIPPVPYWNSKKKWNNGYYLNEIPEILLSFITNSTSESLIKKTSDLLQELSYLALKGLTGEKDIIEVEKPEPSFNQLLGALMKVPPPKKK